MTELNNAMLFGIPGDDLLAASRKLEALFGLSMRLISSGAWGDYYTWDNYDPATGEGDTEISVYQNLNEDEEDGEYLHQPDHPDLPLLISVYDVEDQDTYERAILSDPGLKAKRLLRRVYSRGPNGEVIVDEVKD